MPSSDTRSAAASPLQGGTAVEPRLITTVIDEQCRRRAGHTALRFAGKSMSYGELSRHSAVLADALIERGIGRGDVVAIATGTGFNRVTAVLAVLKSGAAYVPIDLNYPAARLQTMLEVSRPRLLLIGSHDDSADKLGTLSVATERVDTLLAGQSSGSTTHQPPIADLDELAYLVFTSGSTGVPKAVMIPHRGIVNLVASQAEDFRIDQDSIVLQFASFSFDAAASEIFCALGTGATLVLLSDDERLPGQPLVDLMAREKVSVATLPPSVLSVLDPSEVSLRTVVSAGEACTRGLAHKWCAARHFVNAYGPSENTVCASEGPYDGGPDAPSIGRAIRGVELHLLDDEMRPVPHGTMGELHIAGDSLARGYMAAPARTADRFIPNPFGPAGSRMYRSGDLARIRNDDSIEFCGRRDQQVKVRGVRIELGDIETALSNLPEVEDALCLVDDPPPHQLLAWVVSKNKLVGEDLRTQLRGALPAFMVPARITTIESWPQTPNGKIDRDRLPRPLTTPADDNYSEPRDILEHAVATAWNDTLGKPAGRLDDFFAVGGSSLLTMKLLAAVENETGVKIEPHDFLLRPTIAGVRRLIAEHSDDIDRSVPLSIELTRMPATQTVYLVAPASGSALCYVPVARRMDGQGFRLVGLQSPSFSDDTPRPANMREMAASYVENLRGLQPEGPYLLAGWSAGAQLALFIAQALTAEGSAVDKLVLLEPIAPDAFRPVMKKMGAMTDAKLGRVFVRNFMRCTGRDLALLDQQHPFPDLDNKSRSERIDIIGEYLVTCLEDDAPPWSHEELDRRLRVAEHHIRAVLSFDEVGVFDGPDVTIIAAATLHPEVGQAARDFGDCFHGKERVVVVPGDHYTLVTERYAETTAAALSAALRTG